MKKDRLPLWSTFEWIFFSGIFMRRIIDGLDKQEPIDDILIFPLVGNFLFGSLKGKAEYKRYKEQIPNTKVTASWVLINLFQDIGALIKNSIYVNNLRGFMKYEEKLPEDYDGEMPSREFRSLEFQNVSFSYGDEAIIRKA